MVIAKKTGQGRLTSRITIKSKGEVLDSFGEPDHETFTTVASVAAEIMAISGAELFAAGGDQAFNLTRFRIHYRSGIDEDMVVEYGTWRYDIQSIIPTGRMDREWLIITARRNSVIGPITLGDLDPQTLGDLDPQTLGDI